MRQIVFLLNRINAVQVSDTTVLNSSTIFDNKIDTLKFNHYK